MAGNDPLNSEGFSIPTLKQYQDLLRQQAVDSVGKDAPGYAKLMQAGVFDAMRATGKLSRNEQLVGVANTIQQQANDEVAQSGETDPAKMRLAALTTMVRKFNAMGMDDLSAKAMPELVALQQRAQEMRKLKAEATSDESKARVDTGTEGANILAPSYKNAETQAQTDLANAQASEVPSKIAENKASAANTSSEAMARNNEGIFYYRPDDPSKQVSVRQGNTAGREALRNAGWVEAKQPALTPAKIGDLAMPKQEETNLVKAMFDADTALDQYRTVAGNFKPEYLTMGGKAEQWAAGIADKTGMKLDAATQANLQGFSQFRAGAIDGLNKYIHMITGAQMSQGEADRIRTAIPDAERDGPTVFVSKMRSVARTLVATRNRAQQYLQAGGNPGQSPDWDRVALPAVSDAQVDQFLGQTFGMPSRTARTTTGAPSVAPTVAPGMPPKADKDGFITMPNGTRVKKIS